ncbi:MAG: hypothetical protein KDE58_30650 [Caldilineaceae bacterium]|nr:hypothetical protein [Caldilineaceae bacterium]
MAAIRIKGKKVWYGSRSAYSYLIEQSMKSIAADSELYQYLHVALVSNVNWFSFEELSELDASNLRMILLDVCAQLQASDPAQYATREGFEGLCARCRELVELLRE